MARHGTLCSTVLALLLATSPVLHASDAAGPVLVYQVTDARSGEDLYTMEGWTEPVAGHAEQTAAMTRVTFPEGVVLQGWAIFTAAGDPPRLLSWGGTTRDASGAEVGAGYVRARQEAFPFLRRPLPPNTYPPEVNLGYVVSRLGFGLRRERASLNVILMGSSLVELQIWTDGRELLELPAGAFDTYRVRMRITADSLFPALPRLARQLASLFIPTQTVWVTAEEPQRLVRFVGHMGPPGSPSLDIRLLRVDDR